MIHHADHGVTEERNQVPLELNAGACQFRPDWAEDVVSRPEFQPDPARPVRHPCWRNAGVVVGALLFALLSACSSSYGSADSSDSSGAGSSGTAGSPGTAGFPGTAGGPREGRPPRPPRGG